MSSIFISHSSKDNDFCKKLMVWLSDKGHRSVFLDFDKDSGIIAGQSWEHRLYRELRSCNAVIAVCSPYFLKSKWCFAEITHARSLGKPVFPLIVSPIKLDSIFTGAQFIDFTKYSDEEAYNRLELGLFEAGIDTKDNYHWDNTRPPYPGLLAFQEEDAAVFFGRGKEIAEVLENLKRIYQFRESGMVMVLGASGSGKSSLVRAGVIPRLKRDPERWLVLDPIKPGDDPFKELAKSLNRAFSSYSRLEVELAEINEKLLSSWDGETELSKSEVLELQMQPFYNILDNSGREEAKLVLVVDQFEELLNRSAEHLGTQFLGFLKDCLTVEDSKIIVLGTMRSDFLGVYQENNLVFQNFDEVRLAPMNIGSISEIIEKPAEIAGVRIEPGLLQVLIGDTKGEGTLPLLAFTLRELYDRYADDSLLELKEYKELGGIQGSVAQTAEEILKHAQLTGEQMEMLRGAFFDMTRVDEEGNFTRNRVPWNKIHTEINEVLETFVKARLLVSDREVEEELIIGDATVEIAHESLFKSWKQLKTWLDEEREFFLWRRRLNNAIEEWEHSAKDKSALLYGNVLNEGKRWYESYGNNLNDAQKLFLDESLKEAVDYKHKWQLRNAGIITVLVSAFALVTYLYFNASNEKNKAQANYLISEANRLVETDATIALQLAGEALKILPRDEIIIRDAHKIYNENSFYETSIQPPGIVESVSLSPDGSIILTSSSPRGGLNSRRYMDYEFIRLYDVKGNQIGNWTVNGSVEIAVIAPKGNSVLTATYGGSVRLWDLEGNPKGKVMLHSGRINTAIFSGDGTKVLTASTDSIVRIWDLEGNLAGKLMRHPERVYSAVFSPNGKTILTASIDGVRMWDLEGNQIGDVIRCHNFVHSADYSQDGKMILITSSDGACLRDLDGQPLGKNMEHTNFVQSARFSPDEKMVLTASDDGTARLWDLKGNPIGKVMEHNDAVNSAVFSPEGKTVMTSSSGRSTFWDIDGNKIGRPIAHSGWLDDPVFFPDGKRIMTFERGGLIRIWNLKGIFLGKDLKHSGAVFTGYFSPDGSKIITASSDSTARQWDLNGYQIGNSFNHNDWVSKAIYSKDGNFALIQSRYDAILWNIGGHLKGTHLINNKAWPVPAVFSPNGKLVLTASLDSTARLWDIHGNSLSKVMKHSHRINSVAFSPNGKLVLTASDDGTARIWDLNGNQIKKVMEHSNAVESAVFSPDGKFVLTTLLNDTARIWDIHGNAIGKVIEHNKRMSPIDSSRFDFASGHHTGLIFKAIFSPNGNRVLTASELGFACLWDIQGNPVGKVMEHSHRITSAIFSPNGKSILTSSIDGTAQLWDLQGNAMGRPIKHKQAILSAMFSPDGTKILTEPHIINSIHLWDLEGNPIGREMKHSNSIISTVFSEDGRNILTTSEDGFARLWEIVLLEDFIKSEHIAHLTKEQKEQYNVGE